MLQAGIRSSILVSKFAARGKAGRRTRGPEGELRALRWPHNRQRSRGNQGIAQPSTPAG